MKSAPKRTGTFGEEWKGQNESKDFSLKRPVLQKAMALVLETEGKRSRLGIGLYPHCLLNPQPVPIVHEAEKHLGFLSQQQHVTKLAFL